jgi:NDP-hexose-3-ketoreductase
MSTLLVIGCSDIFLRRVVPALKQIEACSTVDIASRSKEKSELLGIPKFGRHFKDYETAISQTTAKWVYISTINSEHERIALMAIAGGKNVIVDKPAVLSHRAAINLIAAAEVAKVKVVEATLFQCHPQMQIITSTFGKCRISRIIASFMIPPLPTTNFRNCAALGGGAVYDMGAYALGLGREIWGCEPQIMNATTTARDGDLIKAFSVLLDYGQGQSLVGHFGFDAHYINRATFISSDQIVDLERIFTIPSDHANELSIRRGLESDRLTCIQSDPFENFFKLVLEGRINFTLARQSLLANAKGIDNLKEQLR